MSVYTVEELAEELSLPKKDMRKLLNTGDIEGYHIGNRWYISEGWLLRYFTNPDRTIKSR